ncbi:MAG: response regulator [Chloroflexi bacterium]|nr:MAG: response regulator [Chloroflexota bacterium]
MVWRGLREGGVPAPVPSHEGSGSVLVADDDQDVRTMLRTLLELDGHEVIEAEDGDVAWERIQTTLPAVVVADIQMPGLDGLQLCRKVRESKRLTDTRVIVYTAGMATPEEARKAGCDQYFLKTDPLPRLREAVRKFTSGRTH